MTPTMWMTLTVLVLRPPDTMPWHAMPRRCRRQVPFKVNGKVDTQLMTKMVAQQWKLYSEEEKGSFKAASEQLRKDWAHMRWAWAQASGRAACFA